MVSADIKNDAAQQAFGHFGVGRNTKVDPNRGMVAIESSSPNELRNRRVWRSQAQPRRDMRSDTGMNLAGRGKASKIPTGFQQHCQQSDGRRRLAHSHA